MIRGGTEGSNFDRDTTMKYHLHNDWKLGVWHGWSKMKSNFVETIKKEMWKACQIKCAWVFINLEKIIKMVDFEYFLIWLIQDYYNAKVYFAKMFSQ